MKFSSIIFCFWIALIIYSCKSNKKEEDTISITTIISGDTLTWPKETKGLDGKQLSLIYCQKCHSFPDPSLLEKDIWEHNVLPQMAARLGLRLNNANPLNNMLFREMEIIYAENIFPEKPLISESDWNKIVEYYRTNAPSKIEHNQAREVENKLKHFNTIIPDFNKNENNSVSLLRFDSLTSQFFVGDLKSNVNILDSKGIFVDSFSTKYPAVDIKFNSENLYEVLTVGNINPSDIPLGALVSVLREPKVGAVSLNLIGNLQRPVSFSSGDLDQDGTSDLVINNFGYFAGSLCWYSNNGNNIYQEHILRKKPGAIRSVVKDLNGDKLPEIITLMTQGDEGIFIYYNKGKGVFESQKVLSFPPVNGSNYFDLIDFNHDGFDDIIYTNGDNADYSFSLKDYHGITIYLNDGKNNFSKKYFYPLYGASKAIAKDFDKDGDLDIAAIAFFADFDHENPLPFVYLENQGDFVFEPTTLEDPTIGRWLTMDSGDFDKDGDEDIVLGKYINSPTPVPNQLMDKWKKSSPYILILDNKWKEKK